VIGPRINGVAGNQPTEVLAEKPASPLPLKWRGLRRVPLVKEVSSLVIIQSRAPSAFGDRNEIKMFHVERVPVGEPGVKGTERLCVFRYPDLVSSHWNLFVDHASLAILAS
jgi:hypothetical protein